MNPLEMSSQKDDKDVTDDKTKIQLVLEANKIKKEYRRQCANKMLQDDDLSGSDWNDEETAESLFEKFKPVIKFDPNEVRKFICALKEREYLWGELTTGKAALPLPEELINGADEDDFLSEKVSAILFKMTKE